MFTHRYQKARRFRPERNRGGESGVPGGELTA
jgi:hypothetical protein